MVPKCWWSLGSITWVIDARLLSCASTPTEFPVALKFFLFKNAQTLSISHSSYKNLRNCKARYQKDRWTQISVAGIQLEVTKQVLLWNDAGIHENSENYNLHNYTQAVRVKLCTSLFIIRSKHQNASASSSSRIIMGEQRSLIPVRIVKC